MNFDLDGRVVIITGAGRGIGKRISERFRAAGAVTVGFDRAFDSDAADSWSSKIECDVTSSSQTLDAVENVVRKYGHVDVLINNAGINVEGNVEDLSLDRWRNCFSVNVEGVFLLSKAVMPVMKRQCFGRIINAASFAAILPSVGSAAYAASKAAVVQLSRVLASELGPWGITVNSYAPGMVPTGMNNFSSLKGEERETVLDMLSIRRWEEPDDVASLLLFLASDAASYITGSLVDVSGGKFATQRPGMAYKDVEFSR